MENQLEQIKRMYLQEKKSTMEIAKEIGIPHGSVYYRLKQAGIQTRDHSDGMKAKWINKKIENPELLEKIRKMYSEEKMSVRQISRAISLTAWATTQKLKESGAKIRTSKEGIGCLPRSGVAHPRWKGGRRFTGRYIQVYRPDHPHADKHGYIMEHRLVAEEMIGRPIKPHEIVHHINNDGKDNRPENLVVVNRSDHVHNHFAHGEDVAKLKEKIHQFEEKIRQLEKENRELKERWNV